MYQRRPLANPARMDRDDEKRMLPCRYFLAGFCHKGPRCKFYHPNMHIHEPFIRVPDLPSSFLMIPQLGRPRNNGVPSLFDMTASSSRSRTDKRELRTPASANSATSLSPRSRNRITDFAQKHNILSPTSHAYSEYQSYSRQVADYDGDEEDEESDERSDSPEQKPIQNTVFNHIDWSEFLVPGVQPPVPTPVPDQGAALSPIRPVVNANMYDAHYHSKFRDQSRRPLVKIIIGDSDMPPEGLQRVSVQIDHTQELPAGEKKLSAKEELQLKVKQIAQELADEPIQHVRSLDSFFRNFKFNGYNVTAGPSTPNPVSGRKLEAGEDAESSKENTKQALAPDSNVDVDKEAELPPDAHGDDKISTISN